MIGVCLLFAFVIHLHSTEAQMDRSQMEMILRGQLRRKQLGSGAFQSLLNNKFNWRNSSASVRISLMTDLLDTLNHMEVKDGQERISIYLSSYICTKLHTEYSKLNVSMDDLSCPYYFDEMSCWPPTPAGTFAEAKCPGYVPFLNSNVSVRIFCNMSGTWEYQPKNVHEFCDLYGVCHVGNCLKRHQRPKKIQNPLQTAIHVLNYCSKCGYVCSVVTTAMAVGIFTYIRCKRCTRNYVHLNLFVAFFFRSVLTLAVLPWAVETDLKWTSRNDPVHTYGCRAVVTLWEFFHVSSYSWMFVEGLYLHNIIYIHVFWEPHIIPYFILGWGLPLVVISLWLSVKLLLDNFGCWTRYFGAGYMWTLHGPLRVLLTIHFGLFVNVMRALLKRPNRTKLSAAGKYRRLLKSTVILLFVFGVDYFFLLVPITVVQEDHLNLPLVIALFLEIVPISFQGFIVAFAYGLYNPEVRQEVRRRWNRLKLHWYNGHSNDCQGALQSAIDKLARHQPKNVLRIREDFAQSQQSSHSNVPTSTRSRRQRNPQREAQTTNTAADQSKIHFVGESDGRRVLAGGMAWPDLNGSVLAPADSDRDEIGDEKHGDKVTHL